MQEENPKERTPKPLYEGTVPYAHSRGKKVKRVESVCGFCHALDGTPCCYWRPRNKEVRWKEPVHYNPKAKDFWCDRYVGDWCGKAQDGHDYCFIETAEDYVPEEKENAQ